MELARSDGRILLTEDKDFGQLAFAARAEAPGVILIRFPPSARATLPAAVQQLVREHGTNLSHAFVVLRPGSVRVRRA